MLRHCVLFLVVLMLPLDSRAATARVEPNEVLVGSFRGWGTSLCWWANVIGGLKNHEEFADAIFTDLGLTIVRYNIGGGENPALPTLPSDPRARMEGFQDKDRNWNFEADANQRRMLRAAVARGVEHVDAFANSPPWWMTVSKSVTGNLNPLANNLRKDAEEDFANYLVTAMAALEKQDGVRFDTITPMNEPLSPWWLGNRQEGCHMNAEQQVRVLDHLHAALEKAKLSVGLVAPETFSTDEAIRALNEYPESTRSRLRAIATHGYDTRKASELRAAAGNTPIWLSEHGDSDASGMETARAILEDLHALHFEEWVYWQAVEPDNGWGLIVNALDGKSTEWKTTPRYDVLRQFTKFIRPGSRIVSTGDPDSIAALSSDGNSLAIVALNDRESPEPFTVDLSKTDFQAEEATAVRTSPTERFANQPSLRIENGRLDTTLPPKSVTTFVISKP